MIIYHPAGLKMRIYGNRTEILESPFFQIFADEIGKSVPGRDVSFLMSCIKYGLPFGIIPQIPAEAAELVLYFQETPGIVDDSFYFTA